MRIEYPPLEGVEDFVQVSARHVVPRRLTNKTFTYWEDGADRVILRVTVDVSADGQNITCDRMTVEAGSAGLTQKLLRQLDPIWFAQQVLAQHGYETWNKGTSSARLLDTDGALDAVRTMRGRRTVTTALLDEVADAYREGGADLVVARLRRSESQAYRLIARAREAGKLPPKDKRS